MADLPREDAGREATRGRVSEKVERAIVFEGAFELLNAQWSLDFGTTVDLRIVETPGENQVNPFKRYQQKRDGRLGQSFHATIVPDASEIPIYAGDVMLAGWGDSSDRGQFVKFWIQDGDTGHPFSGFVRRSAEKVGQLFAGVVLLTTEPGGSLEHADDSRGDKKKPRAISSDAHLLVTSVRFVQWLKEKSDYTAILEKKGRTWDAKTAKAYVKWVLKIESLSELDQYQTKAVEFHTRFRIPFAKWNGHDRR